MSARRALGRAGLAAAVILAAGAGWFLWPRGAKPDARFLRHGGDLVAVESVDLRREATRELEDLRLSASSGLVVTARVNRPLGLPEGARVPAAVLLGGHRTGREVVTFVPGDAPPMVWIGIDYLIPQLPRSVGFFETLFLLPELDHAAERTVAGVLLALTYLEAHEPVDATRTAVIGGSLGAFFAVIAGAVDPRFDLVAPLYAGAPIRHVVAPRLPWKSGFAHWGVGALLSPWVGPVEPEKFAPRVAPRPFLMVNGMRDEAVPRAAVERLHAAASAPKALVWVDTPHRVQGEAEATSVLTGAVVDRLAGLGWFPGEDEAEGAGRPGP